MTVVRSLVFNLAFFVGSALFGVVLLPSLLFPRRIYNWAGRIWLGAVNGLLRHVVGATIEIRGAPPDGPCVIAAKHQSAWDTMAFFALVADPCYVVKHELVFIPLYGWYVARSGQIRVRRSGGTTVLRRMVRQARAALDDGRTVIVFPEGTRVAPDQTGPYHPGVAALYTGLGVPVVPVALNSGLVWGRRAIFKKPGRIILEFLPPIPPGLDRKAFLNTLRDRVEPATAALVAEGRALSPPPDG